MDSSKLISMGMRIILSAALSMVILAEVSGQTTAGRQVISCLGGSRPGNQYIACTAGEAIIGTNQRNGTALTNGFHQPKDGGIISFELITSPTTCPTSTDGSAEIIGIKGCSPPYIISWSNGTTGLVSNRFAPGTYFVTVGAGNCESVYHFEIPSGPVSECALRFFTAFSPNGDGINDTWTVENIERPEFSDNYVEIFNRWGQMVWSGKKYDNRTVVWSGKDLRQKVLPPGTYFFVADFQGTVHKGYVEITL